MRTAEPQAGAWDHLVSKKGGGFLCLRKTAAFLSFHCLL